MHQKKYVATFLAVLLATVEANTIANKVIDGKWAAGLAANVNEYVDNTLDLIIPFMRENGLEPMDLPDVEEGFEVRPVLITYSARLKIHSGYMTGLVNVDRLGDQTVNYFAKMLRVRVVLQFNNLEFIYKYLVKVMNLGPTGGIVGSLRRFRIIADILIDFNNDEIHLQQFSMTDIARVRVRLTGNILTDWLVNPVIRVFTTMFNTVIMRAVESNIRSALQDVISDINISIKDIISAIEAHN